MCIEQASGRKRPQRALILEGRKGKDVREWVQGPRKLLMSAVPVTRTARKEVPQGSEGRLSTPCRPLESWPQPVWMSLHVIQHIATSSWTSHLCKEVPFS